MKYHLYKLHEQNDKSNNFVFYMSVFLDQIINNLKVLTMLLRTLKRSFRLLFDFFR